MMSFLPPPGCALPMRALRTGGERYNWGFALRACALARRACRRGVHESGRVGLAAALLALSPSRARAFAGTYLRQVPAATSRKEYA